MLFSMWRNFMNTQKWRWLGLMVLVFATLAWLVYNVAYSIYVQEAQNTAVKQAEAGRGTLQRVSQQHRSLLFALSIDTDVITQLQTLVSSALQAKLKQLNDKAGLEAIYIMDRDGLTVAASNYADDVTYVGKNYSFRRYFKDAMAGQSSDFFAIGATTGTPGYFISEPVIDSAGMVIGVVAAKVGVETFASLWPAGGADGIVTNANGVVILASQPKWLYYSLDPLGVEQLQAIKRQKQFSDRVITPLTWQLKGNNAATVDGKQYLYSQANMLVNGWQLSLLLDTDDVKQRSILAAVLLTTALFFIWSWALVVRSRRVKQALADSEISRNALVAVNARLEQEVDEHNQAQIELAKIQRQLIQASRMAALGQLSASVIHELGQPLSAFKTYLLAAEMSPRTEEMDELLVNLHGAVERMQVTTEELRNFSRPDRNPQRQVDFIQVVQQAQDLFQVASVQPISINFDFPSQPAWVLAHNQRLQQVVLNLLSNANLALVDVPDGCISLQMKELADCWCLSVADNGPGFGGQDPQKLFEAFYTSNEDSHGIGLGLAICAAIVEEHHGKIEAHEQTGIGAVFSVTIPKHKHISDNEQE